MQVWNLTRTQPATMLVFLFGAAAFFVALLVKRLGQARVEPGAGPAGARRDPVSLGGVAVQMVGIVLASGPVRIAGAGWFDGLASLRTLFTALAMFGSAGLFHWAARTMGANWSIVARTRQDHQLVTGGPFALVRNPIYLAMLLFLLGLAAATGHERALFVAVPVFAIGTLIRIRSEEALLRVQFGESYASYARRVKRIIPWVL